MLYPSCWIWHRLALFSTVFKTFLGGRLFRGLQSRPHDEAHRCGVRRGGISTGIHVQLHALPFAALESRDCPQVCSLWVRVSWWRRVFGPTVSLMRVCVRVETAVENYPWCRRVFQLVPFALWHLFRWTVQTLRSLRIHDSRNWTGGCSVYDVLLKFYGMHALKVPVPIQAQLKITYSPTISNVYIYTNTFTPAHTHTHTHTHTSEYVSSRRTDDTLEDSL